MNNKKGIGHIEMLLSFLIFVGFVIFALYFFNPFNPDRLVKTALDYGFREIIKETTIEIEEYGVSMDVSNSNDLDQIVKIEIKDIGNKKVIAENINGDDVPTERLSEGEGEGSDKIKVDTTNIYPPEEPTKGFVIFKLSEDFEETPIGNGNNMKGDYFIVSYEKIKLISEKKVKALRDYYNDNYNKLREAFNLPSRANFEFVLKFEGEEPISAIPKYRPQGVEIFSDMKRVEVLREDGTTKFAELTVRVW